jgi:hypothetical protein
MRKAEKRTPAAARQASKSSRTTRKISARRRTSAAAKGRSKAKAGPRRQTFVANHLNPNAFEGGLRSYAKYRDLDIASATNGLARAHVIKMLPPCDLAEVSKRHYHDVEFQMVYVLKGWIKGEYEGAGRRCRHCDHARRIVLAAAAADQALRAGLFRRLRAA